MATFQTGPFQASMSTPVPMPVPVGGMTFVEIAAARAAIIGGLLIAAFIQPADATMSTPPYTDAAAAAAAPVKSVNGQTGSVAVPAYQRQTSTSLTVSTSDGTVTWSFPSAFNNVPTCHAALTVTTSSYTFDYPLQSAISKTAVTIIFSAHPKSLSISSLALPIVLQFTPAGVPAGTTTVLTCWAPV